jgi:hypothetical protein
LFTPRLPSGNRRVLVTDPAWGDTVRINANAKPEHRPGVRAAVCGLREVETEDQAREFDCPIGTRLYLVEYGDGVAVEVPATFVELVEDGGRP